MRQLEPGAHRSTRADEPAVVMGGSGAVVTFRELDDRSKRLAQLLHEAGMRPGGHRTPDPHDVDDTNVA